MTDAIAIRVDEHWYMVPNKHHVIWRPHGQALLKNEQFIQHDDAGFYVEG